jgi:hypothetical protein
VHAAHRYAPPAGHAWLGRVAHSISVLSALLLISSFIPSHATAATSVIASDSFDYPANASLSGQNGGRGWSGAWQSGGGGGWTVLPGGFSFCSLVFCLNAAGEAADGQFGSFGSASGSVSRTWSTSIGSNSTQAWIGFIAVINGPSDSTWGGVQLEGSSSTDFLFIGKARGQSVWGIADGTSLIQRLHTSTTSTMSKTFIVARIDFKSGADDVHVWLNPALEAQPSDASADIVVPNYHDFGTINHLQLQGGTLNTNPLNNGFAVDIDELSVATGWDSLVSKVKKPDQCTFTAHALTITAPPGQQIVGVTLSEKWRTKAKARSRTCKDKQTNNSGGWITIDPTTVVSTSHKANAKAPASTAEAEAGVQLLTHTTTKIEAQAFSTGEHTATTTGCTSNRRKHAGMARYVSVSKVRARGNKQEGTFGWLGFWRNCKAVSRSRDRVVADPVDVAVEDLTTGQVSRYNIIDITSRVWDGDTRWTEVPGPQRLVSGPPSLGYVPVIQNTAQRMRLSIKVGAPIVPAEQAGTLDVVTDNGQITSSSATGVFAPLPSQLAVGQSSTFQFYMPEIPFSLNIPGDSATTIVSVEGGGGAVDEGLPDTAIETGCNLTTGVANGLEDVDTSAPQGSDASLGFSAGSSTAWIAQPITMSQTEVLGSVRVFAYQVGMPTTEDPSFQSLTVRVYDGPPWLAQSHLLSSAVSSGSDLEADWLDVDRTTLPSSDDGQRSVAELWCDLDALVPAGARWLTVSVAGNPAYGPVEMPPCPYADPADNAWTFSVSSQTWSQIHDAGSGRAVSFPIDVFAGPAAVVNAPALSWWGADLALLIMLGAVWRRHRGNRKEAPTEPA